VVLAVIALGRGLRAELMGDGDAAIELYRAAEVATEATGDPRFEVQAAAGSARALVLAGRRSEGMTSLGSVIDDARSRGFKDVEAASLVWMARAQLGPRGGRAAETAARNALRAAEDLEAHCLVAQSYWLLASALEAGGNTDEAARNRKAATRTLDEIHAETGDEPILERVDLGPIAGG
jgi:tetratricopeptide (TPR) repeat protein